MEQCNYEQQGLSPPIFYFEFDNTLAEWDVPAREWLANNADKLQQRELKLDGITSGNLIFNSEDKVLVIQRASHDSMPNRWELPGGGVDDEDPTILYGAAREAWEESGLVVKRFQRLVTEGPGGQDLQVFPNRHKTRWFCRFVFEVEVDSAENVRLDPNEHQDFVWASEDNIVDQKIGDRELSITNEAVRLLILEAFRLRRLAAGDRDVSSHDQIIIN